MLPHALRVIVIGLIVTTFCISSSAQERDRKGYLSINAGPTFKLSGEQHPVGLQLGLDAGYELWYGFGISAAWVGGAYSFEDRYHLFNGSQWVQMPVTVQVGYGLLMVGPMYVLRFDRRSSIDFKARIGRFLYDDIVRGSNLYATNRNTSTGYFFSGTYQYRLSNRWSGFTSLDYGTNRTNFNMDSYASMSTLAVTLGVGIRL